MRADGGQPFKIAWLGPADGQCAQLLERVQQVCSARLWRLQVDHVSISDWDGSGACDAQRIIIACETRLDYPWQLISAKQTCDVFIPWGVVTGVWHAGARRTGIGTVTHWQLPWYRWWDGWRGWFFPELARPESLCRSQFESVTLPIDLATPMLARPTILPEQAIGWTKYGNASRHLMIVADCQQTATSWRLVAEQVGWSATIARACELAELHLAAEPARIPDVILWDDSCQDRLPHIAAMQQSIEQCKSLARRFAGVPIIAALTLGHLSAWPQIQAAGVSDFFIKPSHALPLADYLVASAF